MDTSNTGADVGLRPMCRARACPTWLIGLGLFATLVIGNAALFGWLAKLATLGTPGTSKDPWLGVAIGFANACIAAAFGSLWHQIAPRVPEVRSQNPDCGSLEPESQETVPSRVRAIVSSAAQESAEMGQWIAQSAKVGKSMQGCIEAACKILEKLILPNLDAIEQTPRITAEQLSEAELAMGYLEAAFIGSYVSEDHLLRVLTSLAKVESNLGELVNSPASSSGLPMDTPEEPSGSDACLQHPKPPVEQRR